MYLLANISDPDPTRARLLRSSLELLAERGYKGATTREIAARAGVSEVTLFRHYASKEELMREAIGRISPPVEQLIPAQIDDLEAAFVQLVRNIEALIEANQGFVIRLLPELMRHPELRGEGGAPGFTRAFTAAAGFIKHCQELGLLRTDETPEQMVVALVGPLIARVLLSPIEGMPTFFRWLSVLIPTRYLIDGTRGIMLRGAGLEALWIDLVALVIFSTAVLGLASLRFGKRLVA